jgi:hypothetical protein
MYSDGTRSSVAGNPFVAQSVGSSYPPHGRIDRGYRLREPVLHDRTAAWRGPGISGIESWLEADPEPVEPGPLPAAADWLNRTCASAAGHDEPLVREHAVALLGAAGDDRAVAALTAVLRDPEPRVWRLAIAGLRGYGDRVPVLPLVEVAANDPDEERRSQIILLIREVVSRSPEWQWILDSVPGNGSGGLNS